MLNLTKLFLLFFLIYCGFVSTSHANNRCLSNLLPFLEQTDTRSYVVIESIVGSLTKLPEPRHSDSIEDLIEMMVETQMKISVALDQFSDDEINQIVQTWMNQQNKARRYLNGLSLEWNATSVHMLTYNYVENTANKTLDEIQLLQVIRNISAPLSLRAAKIGSFGDNQVIEAIEYFYKWREGVYQATLLLILKERIDHRMASLY